MCRALYEVMLSPEVGRTNKAPMFLSLLFKAMRADVSFKRVCAFVKRLLQVAAHQQPNFACGCLMLTSQLLQACMLPRQDLHMQLHMKDEALFQANHACDVASKQGPQFQPSHSPCG